MWGRRARLPWRRRLPRGATGTVSLSAGALAGSGSAPNVTAQSISLTANSGGIGSSQSAFLVNTLGSGGTFNVTASGNIFITETSGSLTVNSVTSSGGNVTVTVADTAASGENLVLAAGGRVQSATGGTVTLQAGDNIVTSADSTITTGQGQGQVSLVGDYGDQDPATGADFDLEGTIMTAAIAVTGGIGVDRIAVRRVHSGSTLTINTGSAADQIYFGSTATPSGGATGGTLSDIRGQVVLQNGSDDTLVLDDSGDTSLQQMTVLSASQIAGIGMDTNASVQFGTVAALQLQFGSGKDIVSVTGATSNIHMDLGGGDDDVTLAGAGNTVSGFASQLTISGGQGNDTLTVNDTGDTAVRNVAVTGTTIQGLTPGNASGGFFYDTLEQVTLDLGTATDTVSVTGTSTATTIDTSHGSHSDAITVGTSLSAMGGNLTLIGNGSDAVTISASLQASLSVAASNGQTWVTAGGMTAAIGLSGMQSLTLALSDAADTLTVEGSTTALTVQANGGDDAITVLGLQAAGSFDLGGGDDILTVVATDAAIGITGDASDTLVVDESAQTTALTGSITGSGSTGSIHGLTAGTLSFAGIGAVDVTLGSGNDSLTLNESFSGTALQISGGAGNDSFVAQAIGSAATMISGDGDTDTLTLQVAGLPANNAFTSLALDIDQLVIDNSANTSTAIAWTVNDGEVQATPVAGGTLNTVVSLGGVGQTKIIGGTQQDTLSIVSNAGDVDGSIDGNHVELRSGLQVLSGTDSSSYVDYTHAMAFDTLQTGQVSQVEVGFSLTVSGSGGSALVRDDSVGPALATTSASDVLTLISANADGTATGNAFSLYSLSLHSARRRTSPSPASRRTARP